MTKPRFLYLSYFLPPLGRAESRHNVAWLRELVGQGLSAEVMMAAPSENYPEDPTLESFMPVSGVNLHKVLVRPEGGKLARYLRYRTGFIDLVSYAGWEPFLEFALHLHRESPFDFVYSVYGIPLSHKIALEMKALTGLPWIAEFRDPMVHNFILEKLLHERCLPFWRDRQRSKMRKFEGDVVREADLVIVESPLHDEQLVKEYALPARKVLPLGAGFDSIQFPEAPDPNRAGTPIKIGYIGSLYEGYEDLVGMVVEGFSAVQRMGFAFQMVVIGDDRRVFESMAKKHGLKNLVHKGRLPQEAALREMSKLHAGLIMIDEGYPLINSKFWEYLHARLSILALAPLDGAMSRWVRDHNAGYVLPYSVNGITVVLKEFFHDAKSGRLKIVKPEITECYDAKMVVPKIADRIRLLLEAGKELT